MIHSEALQYMHYWGEGKWGMTAAGELAEVDKKQREISKLKLALGVVWAVLQHEKVLQMQPLAVAASEQPKVAALS